jgi:hypothetical protein
MVSISEGAANTIYSISNIALICGTTIALLGTIGAIYSSSIRNRFSNERIAENERLTIEAKTEAALAQENAAKANENAAQFNMRAVELEKQNTELRIKFSNRRINEEQHRILVNELSKHPSSFNIETMGDPESTLYAADILKLFQDSGWQVDQKNFPLGVMWIGIIIYQTNDPAAVVVAEALKKAGISFSIGNQFREKVTIMVGGKPPVF